MYMTPTPSYLRSLLLTSLFCFLTPLVLVGGAIAGLLLLGLVPGLETLSQWASSSILVFLQTFGSGNALEGSLVIGGACGLVGAMFDTYIFYRQSNFHRD
jgi:uncharacterized membrane protein